MTNIEEKIEGLLKQKFTEEDWLDFYMVELKFNPANKHLNVFVDSDEGLSLGKSAKLNRWLQGIIDEENWLGEKYILDVSSPGVGRPLLLRRQYKKNVGRTLKVKTIDNKEHEGLFIEMTEEGVVLESKVRVKEGKRKVTKVIQENIAFDQIKKAVVKATF